MKIDEITEKQIFDSNDRIKIQKDPKLRSLFLAAGLSKTTPKSMLYRISLKAWKKYYDAGIIDIIDLNIYEMQEQGGLCDKCGKPWVKNEFKIIDNEREYILTYTYEPNCKCYPRCMICNAWLIAELKTGEDRCRNCKRGNVGNKTRIKCNEYKKGKDKEGQEVIKGFCNGEMLLLKNDHGKTIYICSDNSKHQIIYEYGFGVRKNK